MSGNLTTEDVQLIAGLINTKFDDLTTHMSKEIRMVKTTVQANHEVSVEARDQAKLTNGRVNKIDNELFGTLDPHGDIIKGKEGLLEKFERVESWNWLYSNWKVPVAITIALCSVFVKESRDYFIEGIKLIKIF